MMPGQLDAEELAKSGYDINNVVDQMDLDDPIMSLALALAARISLHSDPDARLQWVLRFVPEAVKEAVALKKQ